MSVTSKGIRGALLATLAATAALGLLTSAAGAYSNLSCGQLWYERNAIFAQYGHCFQTQQAINTFGRRCYPPYGKLPPSAQQQVNEIIYWERRKGCT